MKPRIAELPRRAAAAALLLVVLGVACRSAGAPPAAREPDLRAVYSGPPESWPPPHVDPGVEWRELASLPPPPRWSEDERLAAAVELGRLLFHDGRLSGTGQMSCASCHAPELGWSDGRSTSLGHGAAPLRRNAPGLLDAALSERFFWDGRAASLEDVVLQVFANPDEMDVDGERLLAGLASSAGYRERFSAAFERPEPSLEGVARAIAAFVRTLRSSGRSAFDRFLAGEEDALSDQALRGLHLFRTEARCMNCHHGPRFTDGGFHDLGLSYYGRELEDLGRYRVTAEPADVGRFKTPTLRNVARTAPYMHNGLFQLEGLLNMYAAGMPSLEPKPDQLDDPLFPTKSPHLQPLELDADDKAALAAFLDALTERPRRERVELPAFGDAAGGG